jgi:hypothetical protein
MERRWDLDDLAATGDLATEYGVRNSTITNWAGRYDDFPEPLVVLSTGPVYSKAHVREWHDERWPKLRQDQHRRA